MFSLKVDQKPQMRPVEQLFRAGVPPNMEGKKWIKSIIIIYSMNQAPGYKIEKEYMKYFFWYIF